MNYEFQRSNKIIHDDATNAMDGLGASIHTKDALAGNIHPRSCEELMSSIK